MPISVADFFCGCGGTSAGFRAAGMNIALGLDNDPDAQASFTANFPQANFIAKRIETVSHEEVGNSLNINPGTHHLFCGCAPCQPFTRQNTAFRPNDDRIPLLVAFAGFVERFLPTFVFVENVPGIQRLDAKRGPLAEFVRRLETSRYWLTYAPVLSQDYGVPQRRRRLVLLASRLGPLQLPVPTHGPGSPIGRYACVRDWIGHLPPLAAGERHPEIANHHAAGLSELNLRRIQATPNGGGRLDWPPELHLTCHSGEYAGHTDVYGRMSWDEPASGLTTRCISLSNGRFGHPTQHRAISVREAACLQTFPEDFILRGSLASCARQIGNAVPVQLARQMGEVFLAQLRGLAECGAQVGHI